MLAHLLPHHRRPTLQGSSRSFCLFFVSAIICNISCLLLVFFPAKLPMVQNVGNVQSEKKMLVAQRMPKLIDLNVNEEIIDFFSSRTAGTKLIHVEIWETNRATNFVFVGVHPFINGCNKTRLKRTKKLSS